MSTKRRRTFYPTNAVEIAKRNCRKYDWADELRAAAIEEADGYIDRYFGPSGFWTLPTCNSIPRSCTVTYKNEGGSPVTGRTFNEEYGSYGWEADPPSDPWKLTDPSCDMRFPTNDFGAYYESGLNANHEFDSDLADDSLLVNELYPDRGESWGVDDGTGWERDDGTTFLFVAYYNHWHRWYEIREILDALTRAYLFTGDREYARSGIVLLDRIADLYPRLDLSVYTADDGVYNSDGGTGQGRAMGCIWESVQVQYLLRAYDAFFPAMDDETVVRFLDERARRYNLPDKSTFEAIRANIEDNIIREVLPAVERGQIYGNFGHHQSALALAGVVLDEPDGFTDAALDHVFRDGSRTHEDDGSFWGRYQVTGGNVRSHLIESIDRDGHPNESPNYNAIVENATRKIATILDGYEHDQIDLFEHVKMERMLAARIPLIMIDQYMPHIGDSDNTGDPGLYLDEDVLVDAATRYDDPIFAQTVEFLVEDLSSVHGEVFDRDPEQPRRDIEGTVDRSGSLDLSSQTLPGFGFTALRQGDDPVTKRAGWLYYGRNHSDAGGTWHNHLDTLNLGLFGYELNLLPDLGYPALGSSTPKRRNWSASTISHNTVMVDERPQEPQWVGDPRHFESTPRVEFIDVSAPSAYPHTEEYRRTVAMVRIDADRSYLLDTFFVSGGSTHHFSFHTAGDRATSTALDFETQEDGTYAGPDVPFPSFREDTSYNESVGNGFNYFEAVERDPDPPESFSIEWPIPDTWDVRSDDDADISVELTMLEPCDDVSLVTGIPPRKPGNPDELRYLLAERSGRSLTSAFTSVIEPIAGESAIESIERLPIRAIDDGPDGSASTRAVEVTLADDRRDVLVVSTSPGVPVEIGDGIRFSGSFGMLSFEDGSLRFAHLCDGTHLETADGDHVIDLDPPRWSGTIVDRTDSISHENELIAEFDPEQLSDAIDECRETWVYVESESDRNGMYFVHDVSERDDTVVFDIGKQTTVSGVTETDDDESPEYTFIVQPGDRVIVPRSSTWTSDDDDRV